MKEMTVRASGSSACRRRARVDRRGNRLETRVGRAVHQPLVALVLRDRGPPGSARMTSPSKRAIRWGPLRLGGAVSRRNVSSIALAICAFLASGVPIVAKISRAEAANIKVDR